MKKVYVCFTNGFEEVEALTVVDLLKRAGICVDMISITGEQIVEGAHKIRLFTDQLFEDTNFDDGDMLVLPGGPGTKNTYVREGLKSLILKFNEQKKELAAICAAPSVFGMLHLLEDKHAVCYPGFEDKLLGAIVTTDTVAVANNITTSRGVGTAIDFSLTLIAKLLNHEKAKEIAAGIVYKDEINA